MELMTRSVSQLPRTYGCDTNMRAHTGSLPHEHDTRVHQGTLQRERFKRATRAFGPSLRILRTPAR